MASADTDNKSDRRNFFRIDDISILYYRVLGHDEAKDPQCADAQELLSINKLTLKARFESLTRETSPLSRSIEQYRPQLAQYLAIVDTKLNMLSEVLMNSAIEELNEEPQRVNISAGGLSFMTPEPIKLDSTLELRVVLLPSNVGIYCHAKVVFCEIVTESPNIYKVAVEFLDMEEQSRDQISRHVLGREQAALISSRMEKD